jgi:predicted MFS family arabinose efflux permease
MGLSVDPAERVAQDLSLLPNPGSGTRRSGKVDLASAVTPTLVAGTMQNRSKQAGVRLIAMLAAITVLSQFYRVSGGVIAPELMRDLSLSPASLGTANGAFFLALAVLQLPCGMLFDRFGPRRTIATLTIVAVVGALAHAAAVSAPSLIVARILLGVGCAGSFMGAVVLTSRWYPGEHMTTVMSWVFALSNLGTLLGATPLAWASDTIGWRMAFVVMAGVTAIVGTVFFFVVRDRPDGRPFEGNGEGLGATLRGLREVIRAEGLPRILAMHTFAYASMLTVLGLWASPYLHDVYGMDTVARGNVLLAMGVAQVLGILCYGPLDRLFNSRKTVVIGGALLTLAVLGGLAVPSALPVELAVGLLVAHCFVTSYGIVIVAHGRSLYPDHLAGRGVTLVNLAQVVGCTLLPIATGFLIELFPAHQGRVPLLAYRAVFGVIALALAAGVAIYAGAKDSRPRPSS